MDKLAFFLGVENAMSMVKEALSVTEKGHKWDAQRAKDRKEYLLNRARAAQDAKAIGYKNKKGEQVFPGISNVLRFADAGGHPTVSARHQAYVEKKHKAGKNAWNPFGGSMTPLKEEEGGTAWVVGKVKGKKKK